ncbi:MAG: phenylacetate--CoA ligase family protein [Anaerolineaceae bacterium]|nr:phenylacetate--CoA ligase family protein [Anaerolineaceae bacterium]
MMLITPLEDWISRKIGHEGGLDRAALEVYQLARLNDLLAQVNQKSVFYQSRFQGMPAQIGSLADWAQFPFTTAEDLCEQGLQFLCTSQDEINRVVTLDTSGTTGAPKRIYFTESDQQLTLDFFEVGMSTFTAPGDRVLILLPCEREGSVGDLLATALERGGAYPLRQGIVRDYAQTLALLESEHVDGVVGIPLQVLGLVRRSRPLQIKSVLLSTDHVPDPIARAIETGWHCQVYNHYGMTEMGLGGGVECQAHNGYHLREADMLFEIIDPGSGHPVPEGEYGEVAFTTLTRTGMPLLRYRTGDISRFLPGRCACGTVLKRLEPVRYRRSGRVFVGDSFFTIADLDDALFKITAVDNFSAQISRQGALQRLLIEIFTVGQLPTRFSDQIRQAIGKIPAIQSGLASHLLSLAINVSATPALPIAAVKRTIRIVEG